MPQYTYSGEQPSLKELAAKIGDNRKLRAFLKANDPKFRKAIYQQIAPHLSFKPKPFFLLNA